MTEKHFSGLTGSSDHVTEKCFSGLTGSSDHVTEKHFSGLTGSSDHVVEKRPKIDVHVFTASRSMVTLDKHVSFDELFQKFADISSFANGNIANFVKYNVICYPYLARFAIDSSVDLEKIKQICKENGYLYYYDATIEIDRLDCNSQFLIFRRNCDNGEFQCFIHEIDPFVIM